MEILEAFAKLRQTTISFFMCIRLSAPINSAPSGRILIEFDVCVFSKNMSKFWFQ
jgi:hypothetical protein